MQHGSHSTGVLGDLVEERIPDQLGFGVALVGHLAHGAGVVGVQVAVKAAVAADLFVDLLLGVLAAEAHFYQVAHRHGAAALGAEAALAVQNVVDVDDFAVVVCADGNAAAHVDDNEVEILVTLAVLLGIAAGHGLLVQRMEDRAAGQLRHAGNAGFVGQLIHNNGVDDVAGDAQAVADLAGQDAAQVGSVLALDTGLQVSQQSVADGVGAAGDGLEQAAAADDDVQALGGAVLLFQKVQDDGLAEILLVDDTGVLGDLLRGMAQGFLKQQGLVLKNTNLGRGRTRVDDQRFNRHLKRLLLIMVSLVSGLL